MSAIYTLSTRCCCDLAPTGCPCDKVYDGWQSGYFDLPARIKMTFDYYTPQSDRVRLSCGSGWNQCYDYPNWYPCSGIDTMEIGFGQTPYDWEPLQSSDGCGFSGCREYNENGQCIYCESGPSSRYMTFGNFDFCTRTCSSECEYAVTDGIGGHYLTEDADNVTPMEDFLETGEVYFERVVWFFGGEARIAYVFDSTHYEPGDPINDSVEWGEDPILQIIPNEPAPHYARQLWTVANMFNSKTSNRCTYPGIADGAGTSDCRAANAPQDISSQHFRMYIALMKTDDDPVCRWRLVTHFWDDMNGNATCTVGARDCGNLPATNDPDECECWGEYCDLSDDGCYNGNGCCSWAPSGLPAQPLRNNIGGDPCDWCGSPHNYGSNCCGCQVAAAGAACIRWKGGSSGIYGDMQNGLGSVDTPLYLFNGAYTPTDNIECYANPFDPDRFHLWGGDNGEPDGPNIRYGYGNTTIPNVPPLNLDWADIVTPLDLARHRWENGAQWSMGYGTNTFAYGFIRVTGFEVTEE